MRTPALAVELLEGFVRGGLTGRAPAWEAEARAALVWGVGQVVEVRNEAKMQTELLKAIARANGVKV